MKLAVGAALGCAGATAMLCRKFVLLLQLLMRDDDGDVDDTDGDDGVCGKGAQTLFFTGCRFKTTQNILGSSPATKLSNDTMFFGGSACHHTGPQATSWHQPNLFLGVLKLNVTRTLFIIRCFSTTVSESD